MIAVFLLHNLSLVVMLNVFGEIAADENMVCLPPSMFFPAYFITLFKSLWLFFIKVSISSKTINDISVKATIARRFKFAIRAGVPIRIRGRFLFSILICLSIL